MATAAAAAAAEGPLTARLKTLDIAESDSAAYFDTDSQSQHQQLYAGPILDAHMHLFDLQHLSYPWLVGPSRLGSHQLLGPLDQCRRDYSLSDYERDSRQHSVTSVIYVQADADDAIKEVEYVEKLIAKNDSKIAIVGVVAFADLSQPNIDDTLRSLASYPHVKGIRQITNWTDDPAKQSVEGFNVAKDFLRDSQWQTNFAMLAQYKLSFDFHGYYSQLPLVVKLAKSNPSIPIIINHSGLPYDHSEKAIEQWRQSLSQLAECSNVSIKLSGLAQIDNNWTSESIRFFINTMIETLGVDRAMFASNFPVDKLQASFKDLYDAFKVIVSEKSPEEQRKLFYDNARRIYRVQE